MDSADAYRAALAALSFQVDLGADEALEESPVDRYALDPAPAKPAPAPAPEATPPAMIRPDAVDPAAVAAEAARTAPDLPALAEAMAGYELCELKRGARSFVFADGDPAARVMVIGEAPGAEEDATGKPFMGEAGRLLDRMLAAIGLDRNAADPARGAYLTNVMPWRPPANATPTDGEIAMMLPFLERHIALAAPDLLILMGNLPCAALLGRSGITRMRGRWAEVLGRPALPMFHPVHLLRTPAAKREAWADLLAVQAKLRGD